MLVKRDFFDILQRTSLLEVVLLWGPRQVGKTTLLDQLPLKSRFFLDDLAFRQRAQSDPALVLDELAVPSLIDEVQYAPNLFPELKLRIDRLRRERLKKSGNSDTLYYLTGSNRLLLDKNVKESLAGRCSNFTLHGFSVREILAHFPELPLKTLLWRGGFPELYIRPDLSVQKYLNDYIISFIEKDIARSAGVEKVVEFQTVLRLLAARTAQFIQLSEIANAAGVDQKTIQSWIEILQRNFIVELVNPFSTNLSKRVTKMKKLHFYDVGLCARLHGHLDQTALWNSPQAGSLFESLVFSEITKTRDNFLKEWQLHTWRTKEKNEIDFILQVPDGFIFIEAKLAIHGAQPVVLDSEAAKVFRPPHRKIVVSAGGEISSLDRHTTRVPIHTLGDYLLSLG